MKMIRLDDLSLFVRTAALGSFSNAAREADLLPGQVSAAIQRLERELDVRLFARSTRSLRLTAEGEQYLPYAREVLAMLSEGRERLRGEEDTLQGVLQIAAPSDLGRNVLLPWLSEFREVHPKLSLRLFLSDQLADVFRDPVDIAIRYGAAENASYVALPLAEDNRRVLVASPDYLRRNGRPRSLDDLPRHQCLLYALSGRVYDRWGFPVNGERRQVAVSGSLSCDDACRSAVGHRRLRHRVQVMDRRMWRRTGGQARSAVARTTGRACAAQSRLSSSKAVPPCHSTIAWRLEGEDHGLCRRYAAARDND
jgi:DNA-binding transcriptional LysR family regulator